jgi:hypothetical protein
VPITLLVVATSITTTFSSIECTAAQALCKATLLVSTRNKLRSVYINSSVSASLLELVLLIKNNNISKLTAAYTYT